MTLPVDHLMAIQSALSACFALVLGPVVDRLLLQQVLEKQGHLIVMSVAGKAVGDVIPGFKKTRSYPGFSFALAITGFATAEEFERQRAEFFPSAPPVDGWDVWDSVAFYRTVAE